MEKKTGIFLTGGGGIGAFHIGFFKALEEAGIKYHLVFGSSVGTMVGGAATYLKPDEMYEEWNKLTLENVLKIDSRKIVGLERPLRTAMLYKECIKSCLRKDPNRMIDINDIRALLYDCLDGDKIKDSKIDFGITTTHLPSMKQLSFFKEDMKTNPLEYILASIYMPIFSRQRIIDDKSYVDIARFRRYPIEKLKEKDCERVFVVNLEMNPKQLQKQLDKTFVDGEEVTLIDYEDKPSILDFSREQSKINLQNGYETTCKILEKKLR